jgi:RNA polymerase sigma-70 factor (ECF subfamily)
LSTDFYLDRLYHHGIVIEVQGKSPRPEIDDSVLMGRIVARDAEALRMLYERHAPTLLALSLRIAGERTEAEQILLDVFWETWDRAERYDASRSAPLTYLTLLTRSRALDARRRRKSAQASDSNSGVRATRLSIDDASDGSAKSAPLNHLLANEQAKSLRDALLSLEDDERSLIEACFFDGFTHVELAARLRQPLGTVKTRIRRGLTRLRSRLKHLFDEPRQPQESGIADESEVR